MSRSLLVTPSYRDAARLAVFGPELALELAKHGRDLLWVIADDGSGPGEIEQLTRLTGELQHVYPDVELFSAGEHLGKGGVIRRAWEDFSGDGWLCFLDADGSVDAATFAGLLQKAEDLGTGHAVIASRMASPHTEVRQSAYRKFAHKLMARLIRQTLKLPVVDPQCGAKCIHSADFRRVAKQLAETGLLFDSEMLLALLNAGVELVEQPVNWVEIPGGTVSPFRDAIPMLMSLRKIRRRLRK